MNSLRPQQKPMTALKDLLEQTQNPDYWRSINSDLSISEDLTSKSGSELTVEPEQMENLLLNLKKDGYFQINSILPASDVLRLSTAIERLRLEGWPPPFAFIYDEFWLTFCRLSPILSAVLGSGYRQLPDFWAWYVDTSNTEKGWGPHRDKTLNTLLPDGMPKSLTIWIPLKDAIPLNGCMYILPATLDPNYGGDRSKKEITNLQDIRALPATAGSVLCWNQAVLHWGGRSSDRAPHPRISFAFEFQRDDVDPYNTPLLDPSTPPHFNQRLGLIGKQILQYKHMYHLSEELGELAVQFKKMLSDYELTKFEPSLSQGLEMDNQTSDDWKEKIRRQFDTTRYPRIPLDKSPKDDTTTLYLHNLVTPYYLRNQKVIDTAGKVILDAGCGSGWKSLMLAEANPGARIVGIDISEDSIIQARQRLNFHEKNNAEFHVLSIEDLPKLGLEFDYINNDEVLYLLPDPVIGLQAMKSVLKPKGIIRSNLHSSYQRAIFYRAQKCFKIMGLMEQNPEKLEIEMAIETMKALKDGVELKAKAWNSKYEEGESGEESVLMNYLLQEDKGSTIPDLFAALRAADLEFVSMVRWRHWELMDLFNDVDNLPIFLAMGLSDMSTEGRLHLFELLHPIHRLLDFWCAHPNQAEASVPTAEWETSGWQAAKVHLHPQLRTPQVKEDLLNCISTQKQFEISNYITVPTIVPIQVEVGMAACLLPLWEGAQPFMSLVDRWLKIRPLHPVTLEPVSEKTAFDEVKNLLSSLEVFFYILLDR